MGRNTKVHLDIWHFEIKGDTAIIYGSREKGDKRNTTEVHIQLVNKGWIPAHISKAFIKYLKDKASKLLAEVRGIKEA